jgi:GSH-dependent disulfide-bond oxidoreductase
MFELYGGQTGNCFRASIALEEAGIPYTSRTVDFRSGELLQPPFIQLNALGKVPILVDRSQAPNPWVLTQSNAIMMFAARHGKSHQLLPWDDPVNGRIIERLFYFVTDVISYSFTAFPLAQRGQTAAAEDLRTTLVERVEAAERVFLAASPYMAGDEFTIADIAAFTVIRAFRERFDWQPDRALTKWFERIDARPAVQRGLQAFG